MRRFTIVLLAAVIAAPLLASPSGVPAAAPQFSDIALASGLTFRHAASKTPVKFLPETMGGGVALLDYDGDGRLDVFFTNGAGIDAAMSSARTPDKRDARFWNRLYRQTSEGRFVDVTAAAGVAGHRYDFGAAVGDVDNDGDADLYVTGYGGNTLMAVGDTFFVYPTKLREYQSRYRGSFLHGGVTPEECILPVALLTPR